MLLSRCWGWPPEAWALLPPIPIELQRALRVTVQDLRVQSIPSAVTQEAQ